MDYATLFETHLQKDADITIGAFKVKDNPSRYGILDVSKDCKVLHFEEKPEHPKSKNASMGVYIFKTEVLKELLEDSSELNDFGGDVIPYALSKQYKVYAHRYQGYFKDVGTIKSLFDANMELIDNPQRLKLHEYKDFPIYTKSTNLPPHHITSEAKVNNSLISDGCLVEGQLEHAILSNGNYISKSVQLTNVISYQNVRIEEGSILKNCIILEDTIIPKNTTIISKDIVVIDEDFLKDGGYYE
jgi:glucose-1-phosphate adenylyltransferase